MLLLRLPPVHPPKASPNRNLSTVRVHQYNYYTIRSSCQFQLSIRVVALCFSTGRIDPEKDIYAIPSRSTDNREIYFLAVVDILTHYGVKKAAAKVAKTVKYGSGVEGISTVEPEQYAARFLEFVSNAIE